MGDGNRVMGDGKQQIQIAPKCSSYTKEMLTFFSTIEFVVGFPHKIVDEQLLWKHRKVQSKFSSIVRSNDFDS